MYIYIYIYIYVVLATVCIYSDKILDFALVLP